MPAFVRRIRWEEWTMAALIVLTWVAFQLWNYPFAPVLDLKLLLLFAADFQYIIAIVLVWKTMRGGRSFLRSIFTRAGADHAVQIARLALVLYLPNVFYANWLAVVPLVNPRLFDDWFARPEIWIFGEWMTRWMSHPDWPVFTFLVDLSYLNFYTPIAATAAILYVGVGPSEGRRYITAIAISTVISTVILVLIPTLGPAFLDHASTLPIESHELFSMKFQEQSRVFRAEVLANPHGFTLLPFLGVSAFPSMHVGHTFLALHFLWARNKKIWFGIFFLPVMGAWVGTVYMGWHWALDGAAGVAIALLARHLATKADPAE